MGGWADERAREWLKREGIKLSGYSCVLEEYPWVECDEHSEASLAALLREVANEQIDRQIEMTGKDVQETWTSGSEFTRQEVRRIIEERVARYGGDTAESLGSEILSRLEALK